MFQATAICRLSIEAAKAFMNGYASLHKGAISRLSMKVGTAWTKKAMEACSRKPCLGFMNHISFQTTAMKALNHSHEGFQTTAMKAFNHSHEGFQQKSLKLQKSFG